MSTPTDHQTEENPPAKQRQSSPGFTRSLGVLAVLLGFAIFPTAWADRQTGWQEIGMVVFFIGAGLFMSITGKSPASIWW